MPAPIRSSIELHVLGVADAEDHVGVLEDLLGVFAGDAHHVADDLQRQRRRDLGHEVALAHRRDAVDDLLRLLTRTDSSIFATCRGVKPRFTMSRSFVCFGASMLIIEPSHSAISAGMSPIVDRRRGVERVGIAATPASRRRSA